MLQPCLTPDFFFIYSEVLSDVSTAQSLSVFVFRGYHNTSWFSIMCFSVRCQMLSQSQWSWCTKSWSRCLSWNSIRQVDFLIIKSCSVVSRLSLNPVCSSLKCLITSSAILLMIFFPRSLDVDGISPISTAGEVPFRWQYYYRDFFSSQLV